MTNNILVLGSSKNVIIPKFECLEVFTCNRSASIGSLYKENFNDTIHTNITPARAFYGVKEIKKIILESKIDNLISRFGTINTKDYIELKNTNYSEFLNKEQISLQKLFLNKPHKNFLLSEMKYQTNILKKIVYLFQCLTWRNFIGCSTGVFAILFALYKHPDCKIIISGIDFKCGEYFVGKSKMSEGRSQVDAFFIKHIKKKFIDKIYCLDQNTAKRIGLKYFTNDK